MTQRMGILPEYLRPLSEEHIQTMLGYVQRNEQVFRNILVSLSDNEEEEQFFKDSTIDDIFNRFVRIKGHVVRVSDYVLGPVTGGFAPLTAEEAMMYIETSGTSKRKKYQILGDNQVQFVRNVTVSMH